MEGPSWFWSLRWHVARLTVGNPSHFLLALRDGFRYFKRGFYGTWHSRWKASDREAFWRRQQRAKGNL